MRFIKNIMYYVVVTVLVVSTLCFQRKWYAAGDQYNFISLFGKISIAAPYKVSVSASKSIVRHDA